MMAPDVAAGQLSAYLPFLIYAFFALAIPASLILFSFVFATRPARRTRARTLPFESGVSAGPMERQRFTISFYLVAILFIAFDIEIVFLYPVAVVLGDWGWFAVGAFSFYIGLLALALVYDWRKGALDFGPSR
jgi:NADH-quinone oxidoreductase subunit A